MLIGVVYMIYLVVSLFLDAIEEPIAVQLAHAFVGLKDNDVEQNIIWMVYIFKVSGFIIAIDFLTLGTYIAYYKSIVKVDTMRLIR